MVVGYARVDSDPNMVLMVSIAVDPDYHSKGMGSVLLKKLEEACISRTRAEFIYAAINKDNAASRVFFERNGYSLLNSDKKDFDLFRKRLNQELAN
jgi:N-acetylglutamate synthase-like GNAT family acetyltransferase